MPRVELKIKGKGFKPKEKPTLDAVQVMDVVAKGVERFRPPPRGVGGPPLMPEDLPTKKQYRTKGMPRRAPKKTLYDGIRHPQQVFELRLLGLTDAQIATVFAINPSNIIRWRRRYSDFNDAYVMGGEGADAKVAAALFKRATGWKQKSTRVHWDKEAKPHTIEVEESYPADTAAAVHWLNNRQEKTWKDKKTTEIIGSGMAPTIVINPVMAAPTPPKTIEHEAQHKITDVPSDEGSYEELFK